LPSHPLNDETPDEHRGLGLSAAYLEDVLMSHRAEGSRTSIDLGERAPLAILPTPLESIGHGAGHLAGVREP
jgi:hypothetical protein